MNMTEKDGGVTFAVRVRPRAKRNAITGEIGGALKVALTAPPVEGRANQACIALLAERLGVRQSAVSIVSGAAGRNKVVRVAGLTAAQVRARMGHD